MKQGYMENAIESKTCFRQSQQRQRSMILRKKEEKNKLMRAGEDN
jgi:hypothetical protein